MVIVAISFMIGFLGERHVRCWTPLRTLFALGLCVWFGAQPGCSSEVCTLIGCGSAFEITFRPADGRWTPGTYTITVTADGTTGTCVVTLPLAPCETSSSSCSGIRDWSAIESGCALPPNQHAISGIVFGRTTPATIDVVVSQDGRQLAEGTFTPSYRTSQPNGPDCPDTCRGAPAATMSIQP